MQHFRSVPTAQKPAVMAMPFSLTNTLQSLCYDAALPHFCDAHLNVKRSGSVTDTSTYATLLAYLNMHVTWLVSYAV